MFVYVSGIEYFGSGAPDFVEILGLSGMRNFYNASFLAIQLRYLNLFVSKIKLS